MLALFGIGVVVGILLVVGVLKLTMREEPTGCLVVFGGLFLLLFLLLIVPPLLMGN